MNKSAGAIFVTALLLGAAAAGAWYGVWAVDQYEYAKAHVLPPR